MTTVTGPPMAGEMFNLMALSITDLNEVGILSKNYSALMRNELHAKGHIEAVKDEFENNVATNILHLGREYLATQQGGTKERRDKLRKMVDSVTSSALPAPYTKSEATAIGHWVWRGTTGFTKAMCRNELSVTSLKAAALGLIDLENFLTAARKLRGESVAQACVYLEGACGLPQIVHMTEEFITKVNKICEAAGAIVSVATPAATSSYSSATSAASASTTTKGTTMSDGIIIGDEAATTTTTAEAGTPAPAKVATKIDPATFRKVDGVVKGMIDANMKSVGLPSIDDIGSTLAELIDLASRAEAGVKLTMGEGMAYKAPTTSGLPNGKPVVKKAKDVFGIKGAAGALFDFDIPTYEWDGPHPYIKTIDAEYRFQPEQLLQLLVAILTNQNAWLYGDTGCGKTTLVEQATARMGYPVVRINFDSEITRMDLIGAKDIIVSGGHPVTEFTEGVLPMAMQMPCILLCDELDFIRADVAYVFQRALEGNGMSLPEDGNRVITPHAGFRIIATANTQGQGDESGRYQGAKPQSAAFLDRFSMWIKCDYMSEAEVCKLVATKVPSAGKFAPVLAKYAKEHWAGFSGGTLLSALSPRGLLSAAVTYTIYRSVMDETKAMKMSMENTFVKRASPEDASTINGLISRVLK